MWKKSRGGERKKEKEKTAEEEIIKNVEIVLTSTYGWNGVVIKKHVQCTIRCTKFGVFNTPRIRSKGNEQSTVKPYSKAWPMRKHTRRKCKRDKRMESEHRANGMDGMKAAKTDLKTSKWKNDQDEATTKCADNMHISIHINK